MANQTENVFVVDVKGKAIRFKAERAFGHGVGWWVMERFTVCKHCDRYTYTDALRTCRPCSKAPDDEVS